MRGPGYKLALDVRRVWRCPKCGYERRADGRLTSLRCRCAEGPFMQLIGEPRFDRKPNRPLDPYVTADEVLGPEEETPVAPAAVEAPSDADAAVDVGAETPAAEFGEGLSDAAETSDSSVAESNGAVVDDLGADESADDGGEVESSADAGEGEANASPSGPGNESRPEGGGRNRRRRRGRGKRGPKPGGGE